MRASRIAELESASKNQAAQLADLNKLRADLTAREKEKEISKLKSDGEKERAAAQKADGMRTSRIAELEAAAKKQEAQLADLNKLRSDLTAREKDAATARAAADQAARSSADLEKQIGKLKSDGEKQRAAAERTDGMRASRIAELEGKLSDGDALRKQLKSSEKEREKAEETAKKVSEKSTRTIRDLEDQLGKLKSLRKEAEKAEKAEKDARKALSRAEDADKARKKSERALDEAESEAKNRAKRIAELEKQLSRQPKDSGGGSDGDSKKLRKRIKELEAELDAATASLPANVPATMSGAEEEARTLIASGAAIEASNLRIASPEKNRKQDNLQEIKGIGPKINGMLNENGVYYFDQIAAFDGRDLAWIDQAISFKGRSVRDRWIPQAALLSGDQSGALSKKRLGEIRTYYAALDSGSARGSGSSSSGSGGSTSSAPMEVKAPKAGAETEAEKLLASGAQIETSELRLMVPEGGRSPDDLQKINGIGPALEGLLHENGVYYYDQIAVFGGHDLAWIDQRINFKGRTVRDRWIPQAAMLAGYKNGRVGADSIRSIRERYQKLAIEGGWVVLPSDIEGQMSAAESEAQALIKAGTKVKKSDLSLGVAEAGREPDDLQRISGIGPKISGMLYANGVYYFDQIAAFDGQDLTWIDQSVKFKGRSVRDRWIPQAALLAGYKSGRLSNAQMASLRKKYIALARLAGGGDDFEVAVPTEMLAVEAEAARLIESGQVKFDKPKSALNRPERGRGPDDLKRIKGIGPVIEGKLNDNGIYYFEQLGKFGASDLAWVDTMLSFKGRAVRDRWIAQAQGLAKAG